MPDPFRHCPELRGKITPHDESFFRTFTTEVAQRMTRELGEEDDFPYHDDATREALRAEALAGHTGDLLIFAYGSLLWDPALDFVDVRRAHAPGHARRFMLVDTFGARGTKKAPGLMAALDAAPEGRGCDGLVFRIGAETVEEETRILFRREMIGPGYHARMIPVLVDGAAARALTFVADHDAQMMQADITRADQVRYIATGSGALGSSVDYLRNVVRHLHDMTIPDPDLDALHAEVEAEIARLAAPA